MNDGNVFLFIGQFGNQIGTKLVQSLTFSKGVDSHSFISVDTENKVAKTFFMKPFSHNVIVDKCILDKTGRGANWAMGYNFQCHSEHTMPVKEIVLRTVKRKIENFHNRLPGIVMIHSLIGGTGGGLGCCILESIKEEFPDIHITSVTTTPYVSGESPMQHYNSLLTLAWLQRYADCVLLFHNDDMMNELTRIKSKLTTGKKTIGISLDEINDYVCYSIANLFHPITLGFEERVSHRKAKHTTRTENYAGSKRIDIKPCNFDIHKTAGVNVEADSIKGNANKETSLKCRNTKSFFTDPTCNKRKIKVHLDVSHKEAGLCRTDIEAVTGMVDDFGYFEEDKNSTNKLDNFYEHLVVNDHMKFISCKHKHSRQYTSEYFPLLKSLVLDQPRCDHDGNKYTVGEMLLLARGEFAKAVAYNEQEILNFLTSKTQFGRNCNGNVKIITSSLPVTNYSSPLSLSLLVNTSRIADYIDHVLYKSTLLYEHSAYLHWFYKFGVTDDYFKDAMYTLTGVVNEYRSL